ncbi:helix-turn-helix domain-containing protein [Meiothermus sp. CFH 77666]|uniref:helix-turn-helix domain-containing protein n=1 Tax=Meiothermus sp. CFH 77666 TaxID=2817942 RepID=UPI001AA026CC|nr:helix-turn-helix domain-containing protein [Meiothermus sp. CFH 77666]MBO1436893.1 helix-turn-helix domain-containing protein [Meiothermus sp. CFH 77666]
MEKLVYSFKEAAMVLGIHTNSLSRYVKHGQIRAVKLGKRVLIPKAEVERLLGLEPNKNPAGAGGER